MFGKCFTVDVEKLKQTGEEVWTYDSDAPPQVFLKLLRWVFPTDLNESDRKEFPEGKAESVGLRVSAETFEEAFIKLANLVLEKFGDCCKECGKWRKEDDRVKAWMKCGICAYRSPSL